jgi:hypothetical protein
VNNHGQGDAMDWTDSALTLICELMAEQVKKGNRPNTHLNTMSVMWFDFKSILLKVDENHMNKTLLSVKYINTSFKGYKRHFPPKYQFPRAGAELQAKHIGHL